MPMPISAEVDVFESCTKAGILLDLVVTKQGLGPSLHDFLIRYLHYACMIYISNIVLQDHAIFLENLMLGLWMT